MLLKINNIQNLFLSFFTKKQFYINLIDKIYASLICFKIYLLRLIIVRIIAIKTMDLVNIIQISQSLSVKLILINIK